MSVVPLPSPTIQLIGLKHAEKMPKRGLVDSLGSAEEYLSPERARCRSWVRSNLRGEGEKEFTAAEFQFHLDQLVMHACIVAI